MTAEARASGPHGGRYWEVDLARCVAILMMVVYHTVYDLYAFGGYAIAATSGAWARFADLTAGSFLFLVGVSLAIASERDLARRGELRFGPYGLRALKVFAGGMLLTLVFLAFGMGYVVFGILHLIGVSIALAYPLLRLRTPNAVLLLLGSLVLLGGVYLVEAAAAGALPSPESPWLLPFGLAPGDLPMPDYRPLLPWFGVVLFGIVAGRLLYGPAEPGGESRRETFARGRAGGRKAPEALRPLVFLGRHSLAFYLAHQPVILAVLALAGLITL